MDVIRKRLGARVVRWKLLRADEPHRAILFENRFSQKHLLSLVLLISNDPSDSIHVIQFEESANGPFNS